MGLGYVFIVGGPKLLEGQRPILAPAEEKPPMVVVTVQGAPQLLRVTSASCHPPPLINALCGASQHAGVLAALMVASPSC